MKIKSCYEFEFQMILEFARILKKKKKKRMKRTNFLPRSQPNLFSDWLVTGSWNKIAVKSGEIRSKIHVHVSKLFPPRKKLHRNDRVEESGSTLRRPIAAPIIPPIEA